MRYDVKSRLQRLWKDEGGWITAALAGASLLGKLFGGGSKASAEQRAAQDQANIYRDRTALDAITNRERALQDRRKLEMEQREMDAGARDAGYKRALHSQYLQNWQPAGRPKGVEMVRGGFNTITDAQRQVAKEAERQALIRLMQGEQFDALPPMERFAPTPLSKASTWEKLSGILGLGLQGVGAINQMRNGNGEDEDPEPWLGGN
jgi:hypothetical protein